MALFRADIYSGCLSKSVPVNVIIPDVTTDRLPMLVLLHGMTDDASCWLRRSSVERYADETGIAVIIPDSGLSWYCDTPYGERYFEFISSELIHAVRRIFPRLSRDRADTYIGGQSMGGFGALKCTFNCPDTFSAAIALSGALDPRGFNQLIDPNTTDDFRFEEVFGPMDKIAGSVNDLYTLVRDKNLGDLRLYMWCGTEDSLLPMNRAMRDCSGMEQLSLLYRETPGGHEWQLWDRELRLAMQWLSEGRR